MDVKSSLRHFNRDFKEGKMIEGEGYAFEVSIDGENFKDSFFIPSSEKIGVDVGLKIGEMVARVGNKISGTKKMFTLEEEK